MTPKSSDIIFIVLSWSKWSLERRCSLYKVPWAVTITELGIKIVTTWLLSLDWATSPYCIHLHLTLEKWWTIRHSHTPLNAQPPCHYLNIFPSKKMHFVFFCTSAHPNTAYFSKFAFNVSSFMKYFLSVILV